MSSVLSLERPQGSDPVLRQARLSQAKVIPFPVAHSLLEASLHISVPAFGVVLSSPIISFTRTAASDKVIVECAVDTDAIIVLTLIGNLLEDGDKFKIEQVLLTPELTEQRARADFVCSTLVAMLGLGANVILKIPEINLNLNLNFDSPLPSISEMLRRRQIAYRLMVIEQATGREFLIPDSLTGDEVESIAFAYHAITKESFFWPIKTVQIFIPALQEKLTELRLSDQPTIHVFPPRKVSKNILGQSIELGHEQVTIEDGIVLDIDNVRRELATDDGHLVEVIMISLSGQAKYEIFEAPNLRDRSWGDNIKTLIDIEAELDSRLAQKYHALATATFAGLTESEIAEVTVRPELNENTFLMDNTQ